MQINPHVILAQLQHFEKIFMLSFAVIYPLFIVPFSFVTGIFNAVHALLKRKVISKLGACTAVFSLAYPVLLCIAMTIYLKQHPPSEIKDEYLLALLLYVPFFILTIVFIAWGMWVRSKTINQDKTILRIVKIQIRASLIALVTACTLGSYLV